MTIERSYFLHLLNAEIEKLNAFFMEKEEEYIICQKELWDRKEKLKRESTPNGAVFSQIEYNKEMIKLRKDIVNIYGEIFSTQECYY